MYVCNCNGLTERQVKTAVERGARKWSDVHAHHGCEPQCGGCGVEIAGYIKPKRRRKCSAMASAVLAEA